MSTGKKIYELGLKHLGETYRLGAIAPKNDPNWKGAWDCAEFTSWLVYQVSGRLYGCANNNGNPATADAYTGFYKRDADTIGIKITPQEAARIKGAFLLRYAGGGVIGHITVSAGDGSTVEAHSSRTGVIQSKVSGRRWDIGVLVPWIDYKEEKEPVVVKPPTKIIYRWTTPLMKGAKVKEIQSALNREISAKLKVDGYFGSKTFYAVREFQQRKGLLPDGEVGPITAKALKITL